MDLSIYGSTGFIGSEFVRRTNAAYGYQTDNMWLVPRWSRRPDPYKKTDILYLISTVHNYNVFTDPTLDVKTNLVVFTETLDSWKRNNPEGVFNFVSSWFVYGERSSIGTIPSFFYDNSPVSEDHLCNPKGFYSITKYAAEQLLVSFAETFGLKYRILRLCNIIGPGDKGASKQKNALQYLINELDADRDIELYENGQFYRTYMDVSDCVDALHLVMEKGNPNEIYNIGTEPAQVFSDLIKYAYQKTESKSRISVIHAKDFHKQVQVKSFAMDCTKLYELGFKPKFTIEQTLDRMIEPAWRLL
jgi:nucleoside-diphosphate-sugar epimerase